MSKHIANALQIIQARISDYEKRYHRIPGSVALMAVSKGQSIESIAEAIQAGQSSFGENYLQEALTKINFFAKAEVQWHFIGPIQRNKTRKIAENFSWAHCVADKIIAQRLNDQRPLHLPALNICIQVNVSQEASKAGVKTTEVAALAEFFCASLPRLKLRGIMALPAEKDDLNEQRAALKPAVFVFNALQKRGLNIDTLSMGMSRDLEAAIAEGATLLRIGTGIFGSRI